MLYRERLVRRYEFEMWSNSLYFGDDLIRQSIGVCIEQMERSFVFDTLVRPLHDQLEGMNGLTGPIRGKRCNYLGRFVSCFDDKGLLRFLVLSDFLWT